MVQSKGKTKKTKVEFDGGFGEVVKKETKVEEKKVEKKVVKKLNVNALGEKLLYD